MSPFAISIFASDDDVMTAICQKVFLETHEHDVQIVKLDKTLELSQMARQDVLLLDVGTDTPKVFPVLDSLLQAQIRPKLLITAFENQIFRQDDLLEGGAAQILFKPFSASELLSAVTDLVSAPHG